MDISIRIPKIKRGRDVLKRIFKGFLPPKGPEVPEPEVPEPEALEPKAKEQEAQDLEPQEPKAQEPEAQEPEVQEPEAQQLEVQEPEAQELDAQEPNAHLYCYRQLPSPQSIRVLELYGSVEPTEELRCRLVEVSVDKPLPYEAISYAWEGQSPSCSITCNGESLLVTENCAAALRTCRPTDSKKTRYLWIDGICIDQNSTLERNHQVKIMGDVYRNAKRVLIWLGQPVPKSQEYQGFCSLAQGLDWYEKHVEKLDEEFIKMALRMNNGKLVFTQNKSVPSY